MCWIKTLMQLRLSLRLYMTWFSPPVTLMSDGMSHTPGLCACIAQDACNAGSFGCAVSTFWNSLFWKALSLASFLQVCSNAMWSDVSHFPDKRAAPSPSISHHPLSTLLSIAFSGMWCVMCLLILLFVSLSLSLQLELRLACSFVLL